MTCGMHADDPAESLSSPERYLILAAVVLGSSLYSTALLTTSTILPQMQGAMSATQDEIAWAMTFNILATAVVTPMTGWLVARFGAKRVMTLGILSFSIATFLCGLAQSLDALVVWRIIQGATGAPVVPLSQTILLNTFPRRHHMRVPVGVLAYLGLRVALPADTRPPPIELDWTGSLALAGAMALLQLVLARGVRLDWFDSDRDPARVPAGRHRIL